MLHDVDVKRLTLGRSCTGDGARAGTTSRIARRTALLAAR